MTNCNACGVPLSDEDAFCPNCGAATGKPRIQAPKTVMDIQPAPGVLQVHEFQQMPAALQIPAAQQTMQPQPEYWQQLAMKNRVQNKNYATAVKAMMVLGCLVGARFYLVPLLWCIPMTVVAWKKLDRGEPLGTAFKVCTCIFVSRLAALFMFLMTDEKPRYVQY